MSATQWPAASPGKDRRIAAEPCVLLKVGEIVLKGGNRQHFERLLQDNIRRRLRDLGAGLRLWSRNGVIVLRLASPGLASGARPAGRRRRPWTGSPSGSAR